MMRLVLALLVLAALAGCKLAPPGTCSEDSQCPAGRVCANGVCAGCDADADCREWQACDVASRTCSSLPGRCSRTADCQPWEACDANHACFTAPGRCQFASDCESWETCAAYSCRPQPGRCSQASQCRGYWPSCDSVTHWCKQSPPGGTDVLLWGTLAQGLKVNNEPWAYDVLVPVLQPTSTKWGFTGWASTDSTRRTAYVEPNGWLAYADRSLSVARVRSMAPDGWGNDPMLGGYPVDGSADDPPYPSDACAANVPVERFVLREGTGEYLYACGETAGGSPAWFDAEGTATATGTEIRAWNASGAKLGYDYGTGAWVVWGADGVKRAVSPSFTLGAVVDQRAHGDGFWMAVRSAQFELWRVANDGTATFQRTYASRPAGTQDGILAAGLVALDTVGNLFSIDDVQALPGIFVQVVVKYPADGSASSVVYDDRDAIDNSPTGPPFIYSSPLVRGP